MNIPQIKNALENIMTACQKKLAALYPAGIPTDIQQRYEDELSYLRNSDFIDDFEIFRCLSEEAQKCSALLSTRGTLSGSFIYYLLGVNCFHPLPAHYYCPKCGHYEQIQTHLFGIDLPTKDCPHCHEEIYADGFRLPLESVWGTDGKKIISFEYNISKDFFPFVRRVLNSLYPNNLILPLGMFQMDPNTPFGNPSPRVIGINLSGFAILPADTTMEDYSDLISYLEDGEPCLTGGSWELEQHQVKYIRLFVLEHLDHLIQLQRATGIYVNELSAKELRNITWSNIANTTIVSEFTRMLFQELKPKNFRDMVALEASSHNTTVLQRSGPLGISPYDYKQMISSDAFKQYPCHTREDFFDYLLEAGVNRALAFDASEKIRKGHANSERFKEKFYALPIPEEIKEVAKNYLYIFPRAHCVEYILIFARLAYYAQINSRAFSKIIFNKKD